MTNPYVDAIAAVAISGAAVAGAKVSTAAARLLADSGTVALPEWATWIVGPVGTLVALGIALKWMVGRLDASEGKAEARDKERTAIIESMHAKHAEKLETLTLAAMKVTDKVSNSLDALADELRSRPCAVSVEKPRIKE